MCSLVKYNGIEKIAKMEQKIIDRFGKFSGKIIFSCGIIEMVEPKNFLIVYIKTPKEKFIKKFRKYMASKGIEEYYARFHKYFSSHSDLVISTEHKMKFEICSIISDFFKKDYLITKILDFSICFMI